MRVVCVKGCKLEVWDGSGDTSRVYEGEDLELSYHEFDGSLGLKRDGVELFCGSGDKANFKEMV